MLIKQLSVFLENREGRLEKVTETLLKHNININSFSLADTKEYGMLRMIVSEPERGREVLKSEGFSASLTNVVAVKIPQRVGALHELLKYLTSSKVNIEYMYTIYITGDNSSVIMKMSDTELAIKVLQEAGYQLLSSEAAYSLA